MKKIKHENVVEYKLSAMYIHNCHQSQHFFFHFHFLFTDKRIEMCLFAGNKKKKEK